MGKTKPRTRNDAQKQKSRVAAKTRRMYENEQFDELTPMIPWISANAPDKCTVVRFATSFIGLKHVLNCSENNKCIGNDRQTSDKGIEHLALEALDGFVIILSKKGTITFVNKNVLSYLGYPQSELLGKSIYNLVLKKDWSVVASKLRGPLPPDDHPNINQPEVEDDDEICAVLGSEMLTSFCQTNDRCRAEYEKVQFSVRVQCNGVMRMTAKRSNFKVLRFTGRIGPTGDFSGLVQPAWSPDVGDLPVDQSAFISHLTLDLKLLFCEGRIHRYMDTKAKDIVGRRVYPFYHNEDISHIQKMHSLLLAKGQCITKPYRWMNKSGGWVWMESKLNQITCKKTGKKLLLCINYVLSAVENKGELCVLIPSTEEIVVETNRKESEHDSNDAHVYDPQVEELTQDVKDWGINEIDDMHAQSYPQYQPQLNYDCPPPPEEVFNNFESPSLPVDPQLLPCDLDYNLPESTAFFAAEILSSNFVQNLLKSDSSTPTNSPTATNSPTTTNSPTPCHSTQDHLPTTAPSSKKQEENIDLGDWLMDRSEQMPTTTSNGVTDYSDCMDILGNFEGFRHAMTVDDHNQYSLPDFDTILELFMKEEKKRPSLTEGPTGSIASENLGDLYYPTGYIKEHEKNAVI